MYKYAKNLIGRINMNNSFSKLYYNPKKGFSGVSSLLSRVRQDNPKIKRQELVEWLSKQNTYTMHKPARKKYSRNKVLVSSIDEQWQADLVDLRQKTPFRLPTIRTGFPV